MTKYLLHKISIDDIWKKNYRHYDFQFICESCMKKHPYVRRIYTSYGLDNSSKKLFVCSVEECTATEYNVCCVVRKDSAPGIKTIFLNYIKGAYKPLLNLFNWRT